MVFYVLNLNVEELQHGVHHHYYFISVIDGSYIFIKKAFYQ